MRPACRGRFDYRLMRGFHAQLFDVALKTVGQAPFEEELVITL